MVLLRNLAAVRSKKFWAKWVLIKSIKQQKDEEGRNGAPGAHQLMAQFYN